MKDLLESQSRRSFRAVWVPLALLASGLAINCSSSDNTTPLPGGNAGAQNTAGAQSMAGASTTAGAAGAAGTSTAGSGGASACFPESYVRCGTDCSDLTSDAAHCGACATACEATQVCNASKCGASPTALVPAAAGCGALRLVLSGTTLYWTDEMHGTVKSIPAAGGTATSIVSGETKPTQLKVAGTNVYWIGGDKKLIRKAPVAGGAATTVATSTDAIGGLTLTADGMTLFYSAGTKIYQVSASANNMPGTVVGEEGNLGIPGPLAYDDTTKKLAYPTSVNGDVDVITIGATSALCSSEDSATPSKNCIRVARSQGSLNYENTYIIGGNAYWVDGSSVKLASISDATAGNLTVASSGDGSLTAFGINGMNAYFADNLGTVFTSGIAADSDAAKKKLVRGQMGVTSIIGDGTKAYWAGADCAIMQVAVAAP